MQESPFKYGGTVSQDAFTNREKDCKKLYNNLTGGINTTIISPRRWGKSSLVEKVIRDIQAKEKNTKIICIDLFSITSEEEFLEIFAREIIKASSNKLQDWLNITKSIFKKLIPKISLSNDPTNDFSLSFNWNDLQRDSDEILNLPEKIAQQKNLKFIVCLDEFQDLSNFHNYIAFEKKLRSLWQHHNRVTFCFYGSKRHMMTDIFNNPSKPFYRFGDLIPLQKISTEKWIIYLQKQFKKSKKNINKKNATLIANLMQNHSWYIQQLAHYTWQKADKITTEKAIFLALEELLGANTPLYLKEIEALSITQKNLLKAIAKNETKITSVTVMSTYRLGTPNNVRKNAISLINKDIIDQVDHSYYFLDPAFELWFKQKFLNQKLPIEIA